MVDRGWRAGEPVRFVAQFDSRELPDWRAADPTRKDAILARVDGAVPTAAFEVFSKAGARLTPSAALVIPIAAVDGRPAAQLPAFDLEHALFLASVLTVIWTVCLLTISLAVAKVA